MLTQPKPPTLVVVRVFRSVCGTLPAIEAASRAASGVFTEVGQAVATEAIVEVVLEPRLVPIASPRPKVPACQPAPIVIWLTLGAPIGAEESREKEFCTTTLATVRATLCVVLLVRPRAVFIACEVELITVKAGVASGRVKVDTLVLVPPACVVVIVLDEEPVRDPAVSGKNEMEAVRVPVVW